MRPAARLARVGLLLLFAGAGAAPFALGQSAFEEVAVAEVRFVDAVPAGRSAADRLGEIRRRIQAALVYPRLARLQQIEGEALVRFDIAHDGGTRDVQVAASSGVPALDRAAVAAVRAASPLPWVYGRLEVPVRFALEAGR